MSVDAIVVSVGTGGSITGIGRYFKERRPEVLIVGVDPEGSVYTADEEHPMHPYLVEGIGKDAWPETMDPAVVDRWIRVSDRDSFLTARRLAREEGLLVGGSCGSTAWGALELARELGPGARILMTFPDGGRSYLSKFHDEDWMTQYGFVERVAAQPTVDEVLRFKHGHHDQLPELVTIAASQKVGAAIDLMQRYGISQLPVVRHEPPASVTDVIGSLQERGVLERVFRNPDALSEDVAVAMQPPFGAVDTTDGARSRVPGPQRAARGGAGRPRGGARRDPHALRSARVPRLTAHPRRALSRRRAAPALTVRGPEPPPARVARAPAPRGERLRPPRRRSGRRRRASSGPAARRGSARRARPRRAG